MFLLHWLKRATRRGGPQPRRTCSLVRFRPQVETLEDRCIPTVLTVTTAADNALAPPPGSLRTVLAAANNGDTIMFAPNLANEPVVLQGSSIPTLTVSKNVTITSGGVPGIVIDGNNAATVFSINSGVTATIDRLTISYGLSQSQGGGILNNGNLTITACTIAHNRAAGGSSESGGGIANLGTLTAVDSTIAFNSLGPTANPSSATGAGIYSSGTLTLSSCTVADNDAGAGNGGGLAVQGTSTLQNSLISGNTEYERIGAPPLFRPVPGHLRYDHQRLE